jgi:predicted amidohydrolase
MFSPLLFLKLRFCLQIDFLLDLPTVPATLLSISYYDYSSYSKEFLSFSDSVTIAKTMNQELLRIATCQFGVTADIAANASQMALFISEAADKNADIVHFSECALSGYAGMDFETFDGYDWDLLKEKTLELAELAAQLRIWVVLGSSHRLTSPNLPHNCLYLINPEGKIQDRYDKRFCTDTDLKNYTPGNHFVYFDINHIKCALLICFDLRFP